jgi:hypothetical protein
VTSAETGKPLPSVYVKVFAQNKNGGKDFFFRDGYTDVVGKFEYSQTSGNKLKDAKKFAILVQSDKYGSKIVESKPPNGSGDSQEGGVMQAAKMDRLQNRSNQVKQSQMMNMKKM